MTKAEEQRLIRKAAGGDKVAAEGLIRAHQRSLYAYLVRLTGRNDVAEDVTQEAFVRVLMNLDRFDPRFRFSTWLFTIARRLFLNIIEKRKPLSGSDAMVSWAADDRRPETAVASAEHTAVSRDALQVALMSLSLDQREVVILFHQQDWPIWLIAEHLQMPEGTVKSHLHRGRIRLREQLSSMNAESDSTPQEVWIGA